MKSENWKTVRLGDVCEFIGGGTPDKSNAAFWNGNIPWASVKDFKENDLFETQDFITELGLNSSSANMCKKGDLIVATRIAPGRCTVSQIDAAINQDLKIVKSEQSNSYLLYAFNYLEPVIVRKSTGATVLGINLSNLKELQIPLPPLATQKHIAAVLDKCTEVIKKHKLMLEKYDTLIKSQFVEMFGDPKVNSSNLPTKKFVDIVKLQRGFDLPVQERNQNGTICVFGSNGVLDKHDIYKVKAPGIVTGRSGTIGNVYYTLKDYWPLNTTLFSVDTHNNNVIYLKYLLDLFDLSRFSEGAGVPTLNRNIVHDKELIDVPLALQQKFAAFVQAVDAQKAKAQKSLEKAEILYKALMQRYFA